jgi:hypothetical protein
VKSTRFCSSTFILAVFTAAAVACGGSDPAPTTPANATPSASSAASSADPAPKATPSASASSASSADAKPAAPAQPMFATLSTDKKAEVMLTKVVPNVGKEFKAHDSKKFEKFGCATCHGPQKKDDPHKVLPKLTLSNGGFEKLAKAKPEMMKFMSEKVVPTMADALGEKPYDPATKQGFGCAGCHTVN